MTRAGRLQPALIAVLALAVGFLLAPRVVDAVTAQAASDVKIIDRDSSNRADVSSKNRLLVDSEASVLDTGSTKYLYTFSYTVPNGELIVHSGSNAGCPTTKPGSGVLTGVNVSVTSANAGVVTAQLKQGSKILWSGAFAPNEIGTQQYAFENGLYLANGFSLELTGSPASISCVVYGEGFGAVPTRIARAAR